MRWFFVGYLGVSTLILGGALEPAAAKKRPRAAHGKKRPHRSTPPRLTVPLSKADEEPPPAGELAVSWALPLSRVRVQIHRTPNRTSAALGDLRGETAIAVKVASPV